jgi:hypothetical protein
MARFAGKRPPPAAAYPGLVEVRHVQPYEAVKTYRCPGCDHEITPGTGHEVVVPVDAADLRRHWHSPCWRRAARQTGKQTKN